MRNAAYVIHVRTKSGRHWSYRKKDDGWTQTGPTGRVHLLSAEQLLSHLLPPLAADQPNLSVTVERRSDHVPGKTTHPKTVAEYLAAAPKDRRAALTTLRKAIKAAAPKATEGISYGILGFKHNGKPLVYVGHAKAHCALYGSIGHFVDAHAAELKEYEVSKGTIRFPAAKPLPVRLVTKMVRARVAEIDKIEKRGSRTP